jgi:hypothetical protein
MYNIAQGNPPQMPTEEGAVKSTWDKLFAEVLCERSGQAVDCGRAATISVDR